MIGKKKHSSVIVVKNLKDLSPKKQFFLSRAALEGDEDEYLEPSAKGNSSPKRPEVDRKTARLLSRSILGDPATFERFDKQSKAQHAASLNDMDGTPGSRPTHSAVGAKPPPAPGQLSRANSSRSLTSNKSRVSNFDDEQVAADDSDREKSPAEYIEWLRGQQASAAKLFKHNQDKERAMEKLLGPDEQNRDCKVLALWQQRQSDWENIQSTISRQIAAGPSHALMMTTADEYRCKREEYDLIMAAVPAEDRFGDKVWQTLLRGGGPTMVSIGHLFSGIECEVDKPPVEPIMVRKPRRSTFDKKGQVKPLVDESPALIEKRRRLAKNLKLIRPHNMSLENARQLVVKSTNLFQWAIDSSLASFEKANAAREGAAAATEADVKGIPSPSAQSVGDQQFRDEGEGPIARLDIPGASEMTFTARKNESVMQTFSFTNTGSVALAYKWSPVKADEATSPAAVLLDSSEVNKLLCARAELPREHLLARQRVSLFCPKSGGTILPGETVRSIFSFVSKGCGGVIKQSWQLETVPVCAIHAADPSISTTSGAVTITLHGHAVDDEVEGHVSLRRAFSDEIDASAKSSMAMDVIAQCLRRLRLPVRMADYTKRCIDLFLIKNCSLLDGLCTGYAAVEFHVTIDRLAKFANLNRRINAYRDLMKMTQRVLSCRERDDDLSAAETSPAQAGEDEDLPARQALRSLLFPEGTLEIFDEVAEDMLVPEWCFSVQLLMDRCSAQLGSVGAIEALEAALEKRDKQRAKDARKAARKGGDDDDEEEEEEEEEEVDSDAPPPPRHPLFLHGSALLAECSANLLTLLTRPLPMADMHGIARKIVADIAEGIVDMDVQAREAAGLAAHPEPVQAMPQPYLAEETMTAWKAAIEANTDAAVKNTAPPAKGAPPPAAAGGPDAFYGHFYTQLHSTLLDASEKMFADVDAKMNRESCAAASSFVDRMASLACVRDEDVAAGKARKVAFVAFDGAVYTGAYSPSSAFDLAAAGQSAALDHIVKLGNAGVGTVVLVYDSADAAAPAFATSAQPSIQSFLTDCLAKAQEDNAKAAAKNARLAKKIKKIGAEAVATGTIAMVPAVRYVVEACATVADLTVRLAQLREQEQGGGAEVVPVLILEDLALPGVVPAEPPLPVEEEDDDEAPIPIGVADYALYRAEQWVKMRPHLVPVETSAGTLGVYSDAPAALQALCASHDGLWIDAVVDGFSQSNAICKLAVPFRVMSQGVRDVAVWSSVLASVPNAGVLLADLVRHEADSAAHNEAKRVREETLAPAASVTAGDETGEAGETGEAPEPLPELVEPQPAASPELARYLSELFPAQLAEARAGATSPAVRLCTVVGGQCRADKFRVLDHVLEKVYTHAPFLQCER